jgi:hypothetical protein
MTVIRMSQSIDVDMHVDVDMDSQEDKGMVIEDEVQRL